MAWAAPRLYRKLQVEDKDGLIYEAHTVKAISSLGFSGPVYNLLDTSAPTPFIAIQNGYPSFGHSDLQKEDVRSAKRLRTDLEKVGVLEEIDLKSARSLLQIQSKGTSWKDCGQDLKVRIEYFTDTLLAGQKARAHLFFAGGKELQNQIDVITIEMRFAANGGRFRSDYRLDGIAPSVIAEGVYVCHFEPWQPIEGSEQKVKSGEGAITLSLLFQKKKSNKLSTVYRLDFNEVTIPVAAPIQN